MYDKNEPNVVKVDTPSTGLTMETLMQMFLESQNQLSAAIKLQGESILESRKPYESPAQIASKQQAIQERKNLVDATLRSKANAKRNCPHVRENGTPNIKWHQHSNNITLGVCGTCFSEFDTRNARDLQLLYRDQKGMKNMGRAGDHTNVQIANENSRLAADNARLAAENARLQQK